MLREAPPGHYSEPVGFPRISADPGRMGGLPTIRDTRVTVTAVLGQLAAGQTPQDIVRDYPYLELDDIYAALAYASATSAERELPFAAT